MTTKPNENVIALQNRLNTLSELVSRATLAARLGQQFDGDRNLYSALGYKTNLVFDDYFTQYDRQDIAKAVITRPIQATWRGKIKVYESDDDQETTFEKDLRVLWNRVHLKSIFSRLDHMACLGQYAVLLFGLSDVSSSDDFSKPVTPGNLDLLYVRPFHEDSAKIQAFEQDPKNPRYDLPLFYNLTISNGSGANSSSILVHHSRVIHCVNDPLESVVYGTPVLRSVFNRLMDLEKLVGGSAEMFWGGARPGYAGKLDPDFTLGATEEAALQTQIDEYEHKLRRILISQGINLEALAPQVSDPRPHVDVQLQMISAATGIPKRILTGSERGELASEDDKISWNEYVQSRRDEFAESAILRPFVDKCVELGIISPPKDEYVVSWSDLHAPSDKQKAEVGRSRAEALRAYTTNPIAERIVPPRAFYSMFLGLSDEAIQLIEKIIGAEIDEDAFGDEDLENWDSAPSKIVEKLGVEKEKPE